MSRPRDLVAPPAHALIPWLRRTILFDPPIEGRDAIRAWFHTYGYRRKNGSPLSWRQLLDMQHRCGLPFGWHTARRGRCRGLPITTHLLLIAWCMVHDQHLGPPWSRGWKPAPRTVRARRASRDKHSDQSMPDTASKSM